MDRKLQLMHAAEGLQAGRIDPERFVEALTEWESRPGSTLADLLSGPGPSGARVRPSAETRADPSSPTAIESGWGARPTTSATAPGPDPDVPTIDWDGKGRPSGPAPAEASPAARRYRMIRRHARGGLGEVWLARDLHLGRDVALKVIRPERTSNPLTVARFLREARITGALDHPNIVTVHDLAEGEGGRGPFYTMRFLQGQTLARAARAYHLARSRGDRGAGALRALLGSFVSVCQAVAYAHSKGVIHRDLKGSNVVLGEFGEVALLDWGLARRLDQVDPPGDPSVAPAAGTGRVTLEGAAMGTPSHMSPEQADGQQPAVDRRSDVYGLGTILYEILTNRAPFPGTDVTETLRRVREEEPARPLELNPSAPAGLEAVCLKAMKKDPSERYQSAAELAEEVRRWLADEPLQARRDTPTEFAARWARRHRAVALSAVAVMAAAVVGLSIGAWRINAARLEADAATWRASRAADRANSAWDLTRQSVDEFVRVGEELLPYLPGMQPERRKMFDGMVERYGRFVDDNPDDPRLIFQAAQVTRFAANVHLNSLEMDEAKTLLDRALAWFRPLASRPGPPAYRDRLVETLLDASQVAERLGDLEGAAGLLDEGLGINQSLRRADPGKVEYRRTEARLRILRASLLRDVGAYGEAETESTRAMPLIDDLRAGQATLRFDGILAIMARRGRGVGLGESGQPAEAIQVLDGAVEVGRGEVGEVPDDPDRRYQLAVALSERGRFGGQVADLDEAVEMLRKLADDSPSIGRYRSELAVALQRRGRLRLDGDDREGAMTDLQASRALLEPLAEADPRVDRYQAELGRTLGALGDLAMAEGRTGEAIALLREAGSRLDRALEINPRKPVDLKSLAEIRSRLERAGGGEPAGSR